MTLTASYPNSVHDFGPDRVNNLDVIQAQDPNALRVEVVAIENSIGVLPGTSTSPSPSGTFTATSTAYSTLNQRLANIETGIVADTHTQYVKNSTVTAKGDLLVGATSGTVANLAVGTDGKALVADSTKTTGLAWATPVDSTKIALSTVTAKGDLIAASASGVVTNVAVGTNGQALVADSTKTAGLSWATPVDSTKIPLSTVTTKGDLIVASGSGAVSRIGVGTNGYSLIADSTATNGVKWSTVATHADIFMLMGA